MDKAGILARIEQLVAEEHALYESGAQGGLTRTSIDGSTRRKSVSTSAGTSFASVARSRKPGDRQAARPEDRPEIPPVGPAGETADST